MMSALGQMWARKLAWRGSRQLVGSGLRRISILNKEYPEDDWTNTPQSLIELTTRKLYKDPRHPIGIVRNLIESKLQELGGFTCYSDFGPVVSTHDNFDVLGFPKDHPGRAKTDTYYINKDTVLRTHTSAHEVECFQKATTPGYTISADVYRRDTIDKTHYSAFHQMEGARIWSRKQHGDNLINVIKADLEALPTASGLVLESDVGSFNATSNPVQGNMTTQEADLIAQHLKRTLELVMVDIFSQAKRAAAAAGQITDSDLNEPLRARWIEAYFPWTSPSFEIEIWWKGEWLEMLGSGLVRQAVLQTSGADFNDKVGWAFGIGLERAAMVLFGIPDIRLFWTRDPRFSGQFEPGKVSVYKPFSRYPGTLRDVAFWVDDEVVHINELMEIVRTVAGDLVENVALIDEFRNPQGRLSQCYRINYQAMDRTLVNEEVNELQARVVKELQGRFRVQVRE